MARGGFVAPSVVGVGFVKSSVVAVHSDYIALQIFGKPIGSDSENNKTTFVSLYGLEQAKKMLEDYTVKAIEVISEYGDKADFLKEFSNYLLSRDR